MMEKVKKFMARGNTSWNMLLVALLVLEFVVFGIANDRFLRPALLFTSINDNLPTFMLSLFVTLVMVTGGIDIQVSSLVGLTSITIGVAWQDFGLPIWGAVGVAFLLVTLCGAFSGFLIAYCRVQAMVVTLGGSFLYSGMALLVSTLSKTESYLGISGFPEDFRFLGTYDVGGVIPIQILIYALMLVVAFILLHKTKYGRRVVLTGVNQSAAEYSGINTRRVIMSTYVLSAIAAAIAGTVVTSYLGTSRSDLGGDLTMDVITAVVLGGTLNTGGKGSIIGTALASFLIAFLRFGLPLCFDVSTQYLNIPVGILLVAVIVGRTATSGSGLLPWLRSLLPGKSSERASTSGK
ncbi:MAG TPA: ABC transporter permease [Candidatus Olsenella pullistercoris]|uniref:Autoinducer 2 import system permease protein LsrD n=1 Tax=Candidatus Olsenella pullistercoris TaxID=2838712 RepID=A0A9D2JED0_9ACTN|nr:ABC transporter permease [Candidatus Olsenella pullistercoris]